MSSYLVQVVEVTLTHSRSRLLTDRAIMKMPLQGYVPKRKKQTHLISLLMAKVSKVSKRTIPSWIH